MSRLFVWPFLVPAGILFILGILVSTSQGPASFAVYRGQQPETLSTARCFMVFSTNPLFSRGKTARFRFSPGDSFYHPLACHRVHVGPSQATPHLLGNKVHGPGPQKPPGGGLRRFLAPIWSRQVQIVQASEASSQRSI